MGATAGRDVCHGRRLGDSRLVWSFARCDDAWSNARACTGRMFKPPGLVATFGNHRISVCNRLGIRRREQLRTTDPLLVGLAVVDKLLWILVFVLGGRVVQRYWRGLFGPGNHRTSVFPRISGWSFGADVLYVVDAAMAWGGAMEFGSFCKGSRFTGANGLAL